MKKIKKTEKLNNAPKHALLFDIETTGLSARSAGVYLIGAAYQKDDSIVLEQFFADSLQEESEVISEFQKLANEFDSLISYNGTGFDLPFLKNRMEKLDIEDSISGKKQEDLYRKIHSYKHIFHLKDYKQKTVEEFLGIQRKEDQSTGGELIPVYKEYVKLSKNVQNENVQADNMQKDAGQNNEPTSEKEFLLSMLLNHNYEDLLGLASLLSLKDIDVIWQGGFTPISCRCTPYQKLDGQMGLECSIVCRLDIPFPVTCSCKNDLFYLHISKGQIYLQCPVYEGSLKYFYPNYKDYYYLPGEDMAIHKSVASFVDKTHRVKATAANCYQKKTGRFLPQYRTIETPAFYQAYKDAVSYFEWQEEYESSPERLKSYCIHMLETLRQGI